MAMTLDAAYNLNRDDSVVSVAGGKFAGLVTEESM